MPAVDAPDCTTKEATGSAVRNVTAEYVILCLPAFLCSLVFLPCVTYSEWYIDELFAVLRNADARGESSLREVFTDDFWGNPLRGGQGSWTHKSYRPFTVLSFAFQFRLLGQDHFRPQPLRAFNCALHTTNSMLVLSLLRHNLRFSRRWSCIASCLFAAHPVHTENIVYLVGRADVLATTGFLLATLTYLHVRTRTRDRAALRDLVNDTAMRRPHFFASFCLVLFCGLVATSAGLCKENGFTLLVIVAGIELSSPQQNPARSKGLAAAFLCLFVLLASIRMQMTQGTTVSFGFVDTPVQFHESQQVRTWSYLFQHAYYTKLLVLPARLSWDYSFDAIPLMRETWRDVRVLAIFATYLGFASMASRSIAGRGRRRLLLGIQQVVVPFVPCSNLFFTVGTTIGERLLYPSTVGGVIVMAAVGQGLERMTDMQFIHVQRGCTNFARVRRHWPCLLGGAFLAIYSWRSATRVWDWRSSQALYAADAMSWPRSVKTRHQLGTVYHAQELFADALEEYEASLTVLDDNALTDYVVATVYIQTGRYQEAVQRFEKIMRGHFVGFSRFNLFGLYVDHGFTLVMLQRFEEAIPHLKHGLSLNLDVGHGLNALGFAYTHLRQLQSAHEVFIKGLEYDPDNSILWNNLAAILLLNGDLPQAAQALERALVLEPENHMVVHNIQLLKRAAAAGVLDAAPKLELFFTRSL